MLNICLVVRILKGSPRRIRGIPGGLWAQIDDQYWGCFLFQGLLASEQVLVPLGVAADQAVASPPRIDVSAPEVARIQVSSSQAVSDVNRRPIQYDLPMNMEVKMIVGR